MEKCFILQKQPIDISPKEIKIFYKHMLREYMEFMGILIGEIGKRYMLYKYLSCSFIHLQLKGHMPTDFRANPMIISKVIRDIINPFIWDLYKTVLFNELQ